MIGGRPRIGPSFGSKYGRFVSKPILKVVDLENFSITDRKKVVFHSYEHEDEELMIDRYFSDAMNAKICGLERKDGKVDVWKNGTKLKRPLRNRKIFEEKYFTDAI